MDSVRNDGPSPSIDYDQIAIDAHGLASHEGFQIDHWVQQEFDDRVNGPSVQNHPDRMARVSRVTETLIACVHTALAGPLLPSAVSLYDRRATAFRTLPPEHKAYLRQCVIEEIMFGKYPPKLDAEGELDLRSMELRTVYKAQIMALLA